MAALKNTGRRYVKSNCICTYVTKIIHGTAYAMLHITIEMQIAFFLLFVVSFFSWSLLISLVYIS